MAKLDATANGVTARRFSVRAPGPLGCLARAASDSASAPSAPAPEREAAERIPDAAALPRPPCLQVHRAAHAGRSR